VTPRVRCVASIIDVRKSNVGGRTLFWGVYQLLSADVPDK